MLTDCPDPMVVASARITVLPEVVTELMVVLMPPTLTANVEAAAVTAPSASP